MNPRPSITTVIICYIGSVVPHLGMVTNQHPEIVRTQINDCLIIFQLIRDRDRVKLPCTIIIPLLCAADVVYIYVI